MSVQDRSFEHLRERYSAHRVMRIFGISRTTLYRWISDGLITPVRLGPRKLEFEISEVERFYRTCRCVQE